MELRGCLMSRDMPDWELHESEMAELLGGDLTVGSGNQFYDISDIVTRENVIDNRVQFMADAKSTLKKSFALNRDFLFDYRERAIIRGKIFLLPVRFEDRMTEEKTDWIVVHANDFSELLGLEVKAEALERKEYLDERAQLINEKMEGVSEELYGLIQDKTISQQARKSIVNILDLIDEMTLHFLKKEDREI